LAEVMRRILVENARRKHTLKQGGGRSRQDLDDIQPALPEPQEDLLALDEALTKLTATDPRQGHSTSLAQRGNCPIRRSWRSDPARPTA
jgi:ECF sigma factor